MNFINHNVEILHAYKNRLMVTKPTQGREQKLTLSQWMGCARFIWNAKGHEDPYLTCLARRYLPVGTYGLL